MREFRLLVPTYNAELFAEQVEKGQKPEFGAPHVAVLIREADGVRVILGSHEFDDLGAPDIQVERQPKGWMIFLHPLGGGDPSAYVYFLDDGRSFVLKEHCFGSEDGITILEPDERVPETHAQN